MVLRQIIVIIRDICTPRPVLIYRSSCLTLLYTQQFFYSKAWPKMSRYIGIMLLLHIYSTSPELVEAEKHPDVALDLLLVFL